MHTSIFSKAMRSRATVAAATLAAAFAFSSCTKQQLEGEGSSYLIIDSLQAASGADPTKYGDSLSSDVLTVVKGTPTIFADNGQVTLRLAMKDPGTVDSPSSPTSANFITVTRYTVRYVRSGGPSTPGVDVPVDFEGALTGTVRATAISLGFTIVRAHAKDDAPLADLASTGGSIPAVAEVTLFGTDQAGRAVSVKGVITIIFANWGDPSS